MVQPATHKMYFIAILCPPELDKKILQFKNWIKDHFGSVVALKSPAHITLIQPFWLEEILEKNLIDVFSLFKCDLGQLDIQLKGFSFFEKRTIFVSVHEDPALTELKSQTESYFINSFGDAIQKEKRPFCPHVTIANRDLKPGDFDKAWQRFAKTEFWESFSTNKISLLKLENGKWEVIRETTC
jgi:2'-5' RNA ligase